MIEYEKKEFDFIKEKREEGLSFQEIADLCNEKFHKKETIRSQIAIERKCNRNYIKKLSDFTEKAVSIAEQIQELFQETENIQSEIAYKIETDAPYIAFMAGGDYHLEGSQSAISKIKQHFEDIANTENLYYAFNGDGIDGFLGRLAESQLDTTFPPRIARKMFFDFMTLIQDRLIALVIGDHELFAKSIADYDHVSEICKRLKKAYLGTGGKIHLQVNDIEYDIVVRHRYRMNSSYNMFHACQQYIRFEDPQADIICIAHNHQSGYAEQELLGKDRVFIRTGTFKISDRYHQRYSYLPQKSASVIPVLLLNTQEKEMFAVRSLDQARRFLNTVNAC